MNKQLKEKLEATMEKYSVSQNQAAKGIGYSGAVLSAYRTGSYNGDVEKLEESIVRWIARTEQSHARKKVPVLETAGLKSIVKAIEIAHAEKDIALIVADAGSGKTTAAKYYAERNERTVILINVISGMNKKMLAMEIADRLGLDTHRVAFNSLVQNIATSLSDRNMAVILDEADYLKADALEFARRIVYDLGNSGLVLIGLPRLQAVIQNLKNDHKQLESRIGVCLRCAGLTKADANFIARSVWSNVESDIVNAIYDISRTDIRQFTKIIERAQHIMALNKTNAVDLEIIEMAAKLVMQRVGR